MMMMMMMMIMMMIYDDADDDDDHHHHHQRMTISRLVKAKVGGTRNETFDGQCERKEDTKGQGH